MVRRLLWATLTLAGCGEDPGTVLRDHPVDLRNTEWAPPVEGDPTLIIGVTEDQLFRELSDGAEAPVIEGFQGGRWVHMSLRATGVGIRGSLVGTLALGDEIVGELSEDLKLVPTREGFAERTQVPIALKEAWQLKFEDLFDQAGSIAVAFTDTEGRRGAKTVQVVYVQN